MEKIRDVKKKHESAWMAMEGVVAVGIGLVAGSKPGIVISVSKNPAQIRQKIPATVEGIAVEIQETGEIRAL